MKEKEHPNFPSKEEFLKWWDYREDSISGLRVVNCPIARYLRNHGFPEAAVFHSHWISIYSMCEAATAGMIAVGPSIKSLHILPDWAIHFISCSDNYIRFCPNNKYRGIPKGFE